jgi:hypothetical protein
MRLKKVGCVLGIVVFLICFYTFLLGNEVFKGNFSNDGIAWYFLAKGIFCGFALYLLSQIVVLLRAKGGQD